LSSSLSVTWSKAVTLLKLFVLSRLLAYDSLGS
jgi:hypothetical protein